MTHPANGLDDVVHQRVRLGILAVAQEARRVEFAFLRDSLELTAGNLSKHLTVLEDAGLIEIEKGYAGKRPRTWIHLTTAGKKALFTEIAQLKRLIAQVEQPQKPRRSKTAEEVPPVDRTKPDRTKRGTTAVA